MAHPIDFAGPVARLPADELFEERRDLIVVVPIPHPGLDRLQHLHDLDVRPAVQRALEGSDSRRDGRIGVGPRRGQHTGGEGGIVPAAVLGVEHQTQVEQLGFFIGIRGVGTDGAQDGFGGGKPGLERMDIHAFPVIVPALDLIGIAHDGRKHGNKLNGLAQHVFGGEIVGIVVVRIQGEDRPGQLVHDIGRRGLDDHILGKIVRKLPAFGQKRGKRFQLFPGGQPAE